MIICFNYKHIEILKENSLNLIKMTRVELYKSKVFVIIWHLIAVIQYNYAIYYEHNYVVIPDYIQARMPNMGGKSRFLTYWCLVCLTFFFSFL